MKFSRSIFEDDNLKITDNFQLKKSFKQGDFKGVDFSKPIIYEGKLNVQKKNNKFEAQLFKLIDKKLIFYRVNLYDLLCSRYFII